MLDINHFIDGASFTGTSGRFSDVFNPNTGEVQARVQLASVAEMDRAVQAAQTAFAAWLRRRIEPVKHRLDRVGCDLHDQLLLRVSSISCLAVCSACTRF